MSKVIRPYISGLLIVALALSVPLAVLRADDEASAPPPDTAPAPDPAPVPNPAPTDDPVPTPPPAENPPIVEPTPFDSSSTQDSNTPADIIPNATTTVPIFDNATTTARIAVDNFASTTNDASSSASTGNNSAVGQGTTTIVTGDATAVVSVINVVNVNIFDSQALIAFLDNLSGGSASDSDIDLRGLGYDGYLGCATCSVSTSTISTSTLPVTGLSASTTNSAVINNAVVVRAGTGGNNASSASGTAIVATGNAYAAANVVNVANTTLLDSDYRMLILNNFGGFGGNIVLPTEDFFQRFLSGQGPVAASTPMYIGSTNSASISNDASTSADTGNNIATSTGYTGSAVITGDSYSATNVVNDVNSTHIGDSSVAILFHIYGNWSGQAFNVPRGFTMERTPDGILLMSTGANSNQGSPTSLSSLSFDASNTAAVNNRTDVSASTGDNSVMGNGAAVITGNAYAASNITNIANSVSVGRNWLSAIINIFGDWHGSLSFGQPDLWVGARYRFVSGTGGPGSTIAYDYTVKNQGDAPAHNVSLRDSLGMPLISFESAMDGNIGTLAPGDTRDIERLAQVSDALPNGNSSVSNTVSVALDEPDHNVADNTDVVSTVVSSASGGSGGEQVRTNRPHFEILNTNSASTSPIHASSTVDYQIHILDDGDPADGAILVDSISKQDGTIIDEENWDLGHINYNEDITVKYTAFFNASTTPGTYINTAHIRAGNYNYPYYFEDSNVATSSITVVDDAPPPTTVAYPNSAVLVKKAVSSYGNSGGKSSRVATTTATTTPLAHIVMAPVDWNGSSGGKPPYGGNGMLAAAISGAIGSALRGFRAVPWMLYAIILMIFALYISRRKKQENKI